VGECKLQPKTILCAAEITVVGHRCMYDGKLPETDRAGVIEQWPPCTNVSEVRMFLGTTGVCRNFIKDYAKSAGPLNELLKNDTLYLFGDQSKRKQWLS
jgi:hypothetical protein